MVFVDRPAVGISPDAEELARKAVRVLITRIDGATHPTSRMVLPVHLLSRVAPAR